MSLDDLERADVTLPREEWGKREVRSTVNKPLFVVAALLAVVAGLLMYFGDGSGATWMGAVLYLFVLFGAAGISLLAVSRQYQATRKAAGSDKPSTRSTAHD